MGGPIGWGIGILVTFIGLFSRFFLVIYCPFRCPGDHFGRGTTCWLRRGHKSPCISYFRFYIHYDESCAVVVVNDGPDVHPPPVV